MRKLNRILALALAMLLLLTSAAAEGGYFYGAPLTDFTLTDCSGNTITLSEVLKEKKMVLLDFWASWCGPCERQFPYLQEAYAQYADEVEVIAVSCEPTASNETLQAYAKEHGLTFPVAQDTAGLVSLFGASTIPMSVVIDRYGVVSFMHTGAITETDAFARLFDYFVDDGYIASQFLTAIPATRPNIPKAETAKLAEALGTDLPLRNPEGTYVWPMIPAEADDRLCLMSANAGQDGMYAAVDTTVTASAGDVLSVTFKLSSESAGDFFQIVVNGETVKVFSGERDWMSYAYAFPADGAYDISLRYVKDDENAAGEDLVCIDSLALVNGDDAAAALARNPVYPAPGDATTLTIATEGARRITFEDPTFGLMYLFGLADYYILPGDEIACTATLAAGVDPEGAMFASSYDNKIISAADAMTETGYAFSSKLDSAASTRSTFTVVALSPAVDSTVADVRQAVCFAGEENVEAFLKIVQQIGLNVTGWQYAE